MFFLFPLWWTPVLSSWDSHWWSTLSFFPFSRVSGTVHLTGSQGAQDLLPKNIQSWGSHWAQCLCVVGKSNRTEIEGLLQTVTWKRKPAVGENGSRVKMRIRQWNKGGRRDWKQINPVVRERNTIQHRLLWAETQRLITSLDIATGLKFQISFYSSGLPPTWNACSWVWNRTCHYSVTYLRDKATHLPHLQKRHGPKKEDAPLQLT